MQTQYPIFEANQVLTDTQLNLLRDYLQDQILTSRTHLEGSGIVCGLFVSHQYDVECKEHQIHVTPGYGFSSEGHMLALGLDRTITNTDNEEGEGPCVDRITFTHYRIFDNVNLPDDEIYEKWCDEEIIELLTAEEATTKKLKGDVADPKLEEEKIANRVLVLLFYLEESAQKPSVANDCNPTVKNKSLKTRTLLVPQSVVTDSAVCPDRSAQLLHLPRFHVGILKQPTRGKKGRSGFGPFDEDCPMTNLVEAEDINRAYGTIVEEMKEYLLKTLRSLFNQYKCFLNLEELVKWKEIEECMDRYVDIRRFELNYHQYHYDHFHDLVCSIQEFLEAVCPLVKGCRPPQDYPQHLMLRLFQVQQGVYGFGDPEGYRHFFLPAPTKNEMNEEWKRARRLFLRMVAMIRTFDETVVDHDLSEEPSFPVRITPSQTGLFPIGEQAIPYYYCLRDEEAWQQFEAYWQPKMCCTTQKLLSYYHVEQQAKTEDIVNADARLEFPPYAANPLYYSLRKKSFFRIEGHLGKPCEAAEERINYLRKKFNLDFVFCTTYLQDYREEEQKVLKRMIEEIKLKNSALIDEIQDLVRRAGAEIPDTLLSSIEEEIQWPINRTLLQLNTEWIELRTKRQLHSGVDHLRAQYLTSRSEFIHFFHQILQDFNEIDDPVLNNPDYREEEIADAIVAYLEDEITLEEAILLVRKLKLLYELLQRVIQGFVLRLLPKELFKFNYYLFIGSYKQVVNLFIQFNILFTRFLFNNDVDPSTFNSDRYTGLQSVILNGLYNLHSLIQDALPLLYNPLPVRFATVYHTLEAVRANDSSIFSNLVNQVVGLEHTGGVEPGGTFIMVCDEECAQSYDGEHALVVADFSLAGQIPCCQDLNHELVDLPPVSMPDFQMVNIPDFEEETIGSTFSKIAYIDILANDYQGFSDYGLDYAETDKGLVSSLQIELPKNKSFGGRAMQIINDPERWPRPIIQFDATLDEGARFSLDHFKYKLIDDSGSEDIATVHVLIKKVSLGAEPKKTQLVFGKVREFQPPSNRDLQDVIVSAIRQEASDEKLQVTTTTPTLGPDVAEHGDYQLHLPVGEYKITFVKEGYKTNWMELKITTTGNREELADILLLPDDSGPGGDDDAGNEGNDGGGGGSRNIGSEEQSTRSTKSTRKRSSTRKKKEDKDGTSKAKAKSRRKKLAVSSPKPGPSLIMGGLNEGENGSIFYKRAASYLEAGFQLSKSGNTKQSKTYEAFMKFLRRNFSDLDSLAKSYREIIEKSIRVYKNDKIKRSHLYEFIIEIASHYYWDCLVKYSPKELRLSDQNSLEYFKTKLATTTINHSLILSNWNGKKLKKNVNSETIDMIISKVSRNIAEA